MIHRQICPITFEVESKEKKIKDNEKVWELVWREEKREEVHGEEEEEKRNGTAACVPPPQG